jgi:hypothetical protein
MDISEKTGAHNIEEDEVEDEENVAVEKLDSWYMYVHVHDKVISVPCGDASQRIKWLAHVGIGMLCFFTCLSKYIHVFISLFVLTARWDEENCQGWKRLGIPVAVRLYKKDGEELDMNLAIREAAKNGDHIFVETSLQPSQTR